MHSPELTVVVICYNVAEFVPACLRSIFHQPHVDKLRILVIDDGSVDDTAEVVLAEIAAHQEVRCELITQPNQGVSGARNTGLRLARTPYVTFVDGDDFWAGNYLEVVMPAIREGRADIIAFNVAIVDMAGRRMDGLQVHSRVSGQAQYSCSELAADAANLAEWQAWARIYKTRLLDGICFPLGRYFEDAAVLPSLYARASRIDTFKEELYAYRRRPGSITSSINDKHIDDMPLNAGEAMARVTDASNYWQTVCRNMIMQIAGEIGRAPRALRRSMFAKAWPYVQAHSDLRFRLNWIFRVLDYCLRCEVKILLRRARSLAGSRVYPPARNALK